MLFETVPPTALSSSSNASSLVNSRRRTFLLPDNVASAILEQNNNSVKGGGGTKRRERSRSASPTSRLIRNPNDPSSSSSSSSATASNEPVPQERNLLWPNLYQFEQYWIRTNASADSNNNGGYEVQNSLKKHQLMLEFKALSQAPYQEALSGLYVMPGSESICTNWYALLCIQQPDYYETSLTSAEENPLSSTSSSSSMEKVSPFAGAWFSLQINIPAEYPLLPPTVLLSIPLAASVFFHPLVHGMSNALDLSALIPVWDPAKHRLFHVLKAVKEVLELDPSSSLVKDKLLVASHSTEDSIMMSVPNPDALLLLRSDWNAFCKRAQSSYQECYGADPISSLVSMPVAANNPIRIMDLSAGQVDQIKREIISKSMVVSFHQDQIDNSSSHANHNQHRDSAGSSMTGASAAAAMGDSAGSQIVRVLSGLEKIFFG